MDQADAGVASDMTAPERGLASTIIVLLILGRVSVAAQTAPAQDARLYLESSLLDLSWHRDGAFVPSMHQSLWATNDLYELMHCGSRSTGRAWRTRVAAKTPIRGADVAPLDWPGFLGA